MDEVRLPELELIQRYSIALRREYAPAEEVIEVLEADLAALKRATQPVRRPAKRSTKRAGTSRKRATAKRATGKRGAGKRATGKRSTAKKRTRRAR